MTCIFLLTAQRHVLMMRQTFTLVGDVLGMPNSQNVQFVIQPNIGLHSNFFAVFHEPFSLNRLFVPSVKCQLHVLLETKAIRCYKIKLKLHSAMQSVEREVRAANRDGVGNKTNRGVDRMIILAGYQNHTIWPQGVGILWIV